MNKYVAAVLGSAADLRDKLLTFDPDAGRTALVDSLRASLQKREVALVLGAGVSDSSGIPRWQNLIEAIATKLFHASKNPELISVMGDQGLSPTRRVRFLENYPAVKLLFRQCLF